MFGIVILSSNGVFAQGFPTMDPPAIFEGVEGALNQVQSKLTTVQETLSVDKLKQAIGDKFAALSKLKNIEKMKKKAEELKERIQKRKERLQKLKEKYEKKIADAKAWVDDKKAKVEGVIEKGKEVYDQGKQIYDQGKEIYDEGKKMYDQGKELYEQGKQIYETSTNIVNTAMNTDWSNPSSIMASAASMQQSTTQLGGNLSNMEKGLNTLGGQVSNMDVGGKLANLATGVENVATGTKGTFQAVGQVFTKGGAQGQGLQVQTGDQGNGQGVSIPSMFTGGNQGVAQGASVPLTSSGSAQENGKGISVPSLDTKENFGNLPQQVAPKSNQTPNINSKTPTGFKKTSENTIKTNVFVSRYISMGHAAAESGSFKTGTDDDGNFYFSDGLANWCGINYDDTIDEDTFEKCFNTICAALNSDVEEDREEARTKFENVLSETFPNVFNKANSIKNKAGSSTNSEDMEDLTAKAGDSARAQIAIEAENAGINVDAARDQLQLAIGNLELSILNDKFLNYCEDFKKAEAEDSSWELGGLSGTDDDGNFYFSDELANWCDLDITKGIKTEDFNLCICTICEDINAAEESERQHNLNRYAKVRGETLAGTYVNLIRYKKNAASFEVNDRVDEVKDNSNDNEQAQMSGLAEIVAQENRFLQYQNLVTDAYGALTVVFDTIPLYCEAGPVGWEKLPEKDGKTSKDRCKKFVRKIK